MYHTLHKLLKSKIHAFQRLISKPVFLNVSATHFVCLKRLVELVIL